MTAHEFEHMPEEADAPGPAAAYTAGAHARYACKEHTGAPCECICMLTEEPPRPTGAPQPTAIELLALTMFSARPWTLVLSHKAFLSTGGRGVDAPLVAIDDPLVLYGLSGPVPKILDAALTKLRRKHPRHGAVHSAYNVDGGWMVEFDCAARRATVCTMAER